MGCGCQKRAGEIESKTGVPRAVQHAGVGAIALGGAAVAHNTIKGGGGTLITVGLVALAAYAFSLGWRAR